MREGEMSQWDCNEERELEHAPLDECIPSLLSVSPWGKWREWKGKTLESGINWGTHTASVPKSIYPGSCYLYAVLATNKRKKRFEVPA